METDTDKTCEHLPDECGRCVKCGQDVPTIGPDLPPGIDEDDVPN